LHATVKIIAPVIMQLVNMAIRFIILNIYY